MDMFATTQFRRALYTGNSCIVIDCMEPKEKRDLPGYSKFVLKVSNKGYS